MEITYKVYVMKEITDKKLFCKLYGHKVPCMEHFTYYMTRIGETCHVKPQMLSFTAMEAEHENVKGYMLKSRQRILDHIRERAGYALDTINAGAQVMSEGDQTKHCDAGELISFDIRQANHTVVHMRCPELPYNWSDMLAAFGIHDALTMSKHFRQTVYGHFFPKRLARLQATIIQGLIDQVACAYGVEPIQRTPDEVIYLADSIQLPTTSSLSVIPTWAECGSKAPTFRMRQYRLQKIEDGYVKHYTTGEKELYGVPGSRFFVNYSRHVLEEEPTKLDMLFTIEGHTAMWID